MDVSADVRTSNALCPMVNFVLKPILSLVQQIGRSCVGLGSWRTVFRRSCRCNAASGFSSTVVPHPFAANFAA